MTQNKSLNLDNDFWKEFENYKGQKGDKLIHVRAIIMKHYDHITWYKNNGYTFTHIYKYLKDKDELNCTYVQFTKIYRAIKKSHDDLAKEQQQQNQVQNQNYPTNNEKITMDNFMIRSASKNNK